MDKARGIDVAHHQGAINWQQVADDGIRFAFIRASAVGTSSGKNFADRRFEENWQNAQAAGLLLSAYHFYIPQEDCIAQIDYFLSILANRDRNFPLVLDFEKTGGLSADQVADCIHRAVDAIEDHTGQKPIIYSRATWWGRYVPVTEKWINYDFWVANYGNPAGPLLPDHWSDWRFWQWTEEGTVPGIATAVDLNWFNGTEAELALYASQ